MQAGNGNAAAHRVRVGWKHRKMYNICIDLELSAAQSHSIFEKNWRSKFWRTTCMQPWKIVIRRTEINFLSGSLNPKALKFFELHTSWWNRKHEKNDMATELISSEIMQIYLKNGNGRQRINLLCKRLEVDLSTIFRVTKFPVTKKK